PFYKALADKFGRKLFLIINTAAMGFGLFVCFLAPHWAVYILGILIVQFVQTNDVQVIYIMETAPEKHRALLCNLTKAVALISVALIGVLRNLFYDPAVPSSWHMVFLIPAIVGMTVGLACIFLIRETPVFVKNRLEYLDMTDEERAARAAKEKQKNSNAQGGVMAALRYIFGSKQLRRVCLAGFVFMIATGITSQYSTILERGEDLGKLTENSVDTVLIIYPFVWGAVTFVCGYLSDLLGRKNSSILFNIVAIIGVSIFGLGVNLGWPVWLIACGYGLFLGTLWSVSDTLCLVMPAESSPTAMRASVMGTTSLIIGIGMGLSQGIYMIAINVFQGSSFAWFSMGISAIFLIASTFLLLRTSETKDANLYTVGDE
ncbi:MAG: MFS transporter, partial [Lachnospiraceae bacterium]|nr:MFS transporter [Lachnospiraceae bacterium]